ncbi:MAG: hypothetical protein HDQ88_10495 [Clostridia bacterium]|nr:hypothetical protein [Clostridia bacterium]
MNINVLDFETFWSSKDYTLSKMGPVEYIRDPRFDAQMIGVSVNGAPAQVFDNCASAISKFNTTDAYIGHNIGGFDALILSERYGFHPQHIWDTIWMARWCGIARLGGESHAVLTELLGNGVKKAGTVVSDGKQYPKEFSLQEQQFFRGYCADDVNQCRANMQAMIPYMTDDALKFMSITARMATEPVFVLDEVMLDEYIRQLDAEAEDARQKVMSLFHFGSLTEFFQALRSADKFAEMLRALGVEPPTKLSEKKTATAIAKIEAQIATLGRGDNIFGGITETARCGVRAQDAGDSRSVLQRQLVELREHGVRTYAFSKSDLDFLELREHEDPRVRLLVETRLEFNSSILRSRAETLLKFARQHKPLPIMLSAFKAHTSRYSAGVSEGKSDGVQIQNLSKRNPAHLVLRKSIKAPAGYVIVAADSSQVELRVNAWMAQQQDLLEVLRAGRDPYAELAVHFDSQYTAMQIHDGAKSGDKHCKKLRNVAKQLLLACGYGTSAEKFAVTLLRQGMHLAESKDEHRLIAERYHSIYRQNNSSIVYFWKLCGQVLKAMITGGSGKFGGPNGDTFEYGMMRLGPLAKKVPSIKLPSGYILRYPGLRVDSEDNIVYDFKLGKNLVPRRIYGSALDENLCQALAFQTLMYQACRMEEAGIALKANIHDSWATVVLEAQADTTARAMVRHMRAVPPWLTGCPLDAEAEVGTDFTVV